MPTWWRPYAARRRPTARHRQNATNAVRSSSANWRCCDLFGNTQGNTICGTDGGDNFSADPQVFAHPSLATADLLPLRTGEADLRGESVGLSPYAACFLRLT